MGIRDDALEHLNAPFERGSSANWDTDVEGLGPARHSWEERRSSCFEQLNWDSQADAERLQALQLAVANDLGNVSNVTDDAPLSDQMKGFRGTLWKQAHGLYLPRAFEFRKLPN